MVVVVLVLVVLVLVLVVVLVVLVVLVVVLVVLVVMMMVMRMLSTWKREKSSAFVCIFQGFSSSSAIIPPILVQLRRRLQCCMTPSCSPQSPTTSPYLFWCMQKMLNQSAALKSGWSSARIHCTAWGV